MLGAVGPRPAADLLVITVDIFLLDKAFKIFASTEPFAIDRLRAFDAIRLDHSAKGHPKIPAGDSAVPAGRAFAGPVFLQDSHLAAGTRENQACA